MRMSAPVSIGTPVNGASSFDHDPEVSAFQRRAVWRPEVAPHVLILAAAPESSRPSFGLDLEGLRPVVDVRRDDQRHLVLADRDGELQLWVRDPDAALRPAFLVPRDEVIDLRTESMLRLERRLSGRRPGPPPRALRLTPMRRDRLILLLHALDYQLSGAKPRQIAAALLDKDAARLRAIEWKSSALRRRTMRLIEDGLALMRGGYVDLLRGRSEV